VKIDNIREVVDKWLIPQRSVVAFRVAAFESLIVLGESDLKLKGVKAFDKLSFEDRSRILAPLVASMGNDGTMFSWMKATDLFMKQRVTTPPPVVIPVKGRTLGQQTRSELTLQLTTQTSTDLAPVGMSGGFKKAKSSSNLMNLFKDPREGGF